MLSLRESGGQIKPALLAALKLDGRRLNRPFGLFRVGGGEMDKCLLAVLPVGGRRMKWRKLSHQLLE